MIDADDLATRLTNRDVTPARLRKLQKLIVRVKADTDAVIAAVEKQSGANVAQQVREALA